MEKRLVLENLTEFTINTIAETDDISQRFDMDIRTSTLNRTDDDKITDLSDVFSLVDLFFEEVYRRCWHSWYLFTDSFVRDGSELIIESTQRCCCLSEDRHIGCFDTLRLCERTSKFIELGFECLKFCSFCTKLSLFCTFFFCSFYLCRECLLSREDCSLEEGDVIF